MVFITHNYFLKTNLSTQKTSLVLKDKVLKVDLKKLKILTYTGNNLRRVSMRVFVCREATEVSKLGSKSSKVEKCHRRSKDKLLKWKR